MNTLHIGRISAEQEIAIGRSRRAAAIIALLFPVAVVGVIIANIFGVRFDIDSFLEHPFFLMYLVPGVFALFWWCKRYTQPAIEALREKTPMSLCGRVLHICGRKYIIERDFDLKFDRSFIRVSNGDSYIGVYPAFFIRIDDTDSMIQRHIEYGEAP